MRQYCEGDNQERENIMFTENQDPLCIWKLYTGYYLFIDNGDGDNMEKINYCPMCGKHLA